LLANRLVAPGFWLPDLEIPGRGKCYEGARRSQDFDIFDTFRDGFAGGGGGGAIIEFDFAGTMATERRAVPIPHDRELAH
jgi:hypothetical protein